MYRQPLIVDAAMPAAAAAARLGLYDDAYPVVVRRQDGHRLLYYLFTVTRLRAGLDAAAPGLPLADALALGETTPAPVARGGVRAGGYPAVLLDENDQVLAVLEAEADFPAAASRESSAGKPRFGGFRSWGRQPERELACGEREMEARSTRGCPLECEHAPGGPQREAFPALSAPAVVGPGERFELVIGLAGAARPGSEGAVVLSPAAGEETVALGIQVVADGFDAPEGWRRTLHVRLDDVGAACVAVPLAARPGAEPVRISLLMVHFTCRGAPCGVASRRIVVERRPDRGAFGTSSAPAAAADARVVLEPERAPDLTIRIDKPDANQATGRFVWSIESAHDIAPFAPAVTDLGLDAASFARTVIGSVTGSEGPLLDNAVRGVAMRIADKVPPAVWDALRAVADRVRTVDPGRLPTVLLLSAEPHVPWELACLDPPLDPARPPFLGAQVAVSRWILAPRGIPLPPPGAVAVRRMAVVAGKYAGGGRLCPLPLAVAEAAELVREYGATAFDATPSDMRRLLDGAVPGAAGAGGVQAIHFACHGAVDGGDPKYAGIYLDDESALSPVMFRSARVAKSDTPFLFLNACQVGNAGELLGEYAGFAGEALRGGFSGFLAPLWSVRDDMAYDFALEFYRKAFSATPVADILCELRGRYLANGNGIARSTYLAYVFYGNPNLLLTHDADTSALAPT
jgi:hypothetical protein